MHTDSKVRIQRDIRKRDHRQNQIKLQYEANMIALGEQGDIRDKFIKGHGIPLLTPKNFRPIDLHIDKCKICYEENINTMLYPCQCKLFCTDCRKMVTNKCPLGHGKIEEIVTIFDIKQSIGTV